MSNQGFFELGLLDMAARPVSESNVKVGFFRATENREISRATGLSFPPSHRFALPAFPQERQMFCEVTPPRFLQRKSGVFLLTDGETVSRNLTLFRRSDKWKAEFVAWDSLPNLHLPLKKVLDGSPAVKVKGGGKIGKFTQATYDNVGDQKTVLAKAALLNLYVKTTETLDPTGAGEPWFSFVREVLEIGRERFVAVVNPEMEAHVRAISDNIGDFPDYKKTNAQNHFNSFPAAFNVVRSRMVSVKTKEENGNLQLTMARGKDPSGADIFLLDADIDENGKLMQHIADLLRHKFNGGTHPFDIHEYLVFSDPNRPLGYTLV
ncbi:MAG TPA: hypothetical protein VGB98_15650 [Pyrinomonadaceae bacterium]|jgi:hypothetical protein